MKLDDMINMVAILKGQGLCVNYERAYIEHSGARWALLAGQELSNFSCLLLNTIFLLRGQVGA